MSRVNIHKDGHCHYTGSLSKQYLQNRLSILYPNHECSIESILPHFTKDWHENFSSFFISYQTIQSITRSTILEEQNQLYSSGAYDICNRYLVEGTESFDLRAGPKKDIKETISRIDAMTKGFQKAEADFSASQKGNIVLTLIHDQNGEFINTDENTLAELLKSIDINPKIFHRVIGFDFSGPENNINTKKILSLLDILEHNEYGNKLYSKYTITVHAGEYIDSQKYLNSFQYINTLLDQGINRLSHGTILWLHPSLIDKNNQEKIQIIQTNLLQKIAEKNIILEICPTANYFLSPLKNISDIPFSVFDKMGINYTINTDNKTLFGTNLSKEIFLTQKH